jgi:hypothetical protein
MTLIDRLRFSWRWRTRRIQVSLPRRVRPAEHPYGFTPRRQSIPVAVIVPALLVAVALGGLLGARMSATTPASSPIDLLATPTPAAASDEQLRGAISELNIQRASSRNDLATATSPAGQAAAARALAAENRSAGAALGATQQPVAMALGRAAAAYAALERAAEKGDDAAFTRASVAVEAAEQDLRRLLGSRL